MPEDWAKYFSFLEKLPVQEKRPVQPDLRPLELDLRPVELDLRPVELDLRLDKRDAFFVHNAVQKAEPRKKAYLRNSCVHPSPAY